MSRFISRAAIVLVAITILVMLISYLRVQSRIIEPVRSMHRIAAGSFEGVNIHDAYPPRSRKRWSPRSVEFESTAGVVEVYVVPVSLAGTMRHKNYIQQLTEEFAAGIAPKDAIHLSGRTGRMSLKNFPQNNKLPNYLLLIRSDVKTDVMVVVHY